jgi:hypothetical protein
MRANVIILPEPRVDNDLGLLGRREPLGIENLVPERPIEALVVAVLPGRARIDPDGLNADTLEPVLGWRPEAWCRSWSGGLRRREPVRRPEGKAA